MEEKKVNGGATFSFSKNETMVDVTCDESNFLRSPDDKSLVNSKTLHDLNSVLSDFKIDQNNQQVNGNRIPETRQIEN